MCHSKNPILSASLVLIQCNTARRRIEYMHTRENIGRCINLVQEPDNIQKYTVTDSRKIRSQMLSVRINKGNQQKQCHTCS